MFLPIGDYPNPPRAQWVTRILLGLNIAIHFLIAMPAQRQALSQADLQDRATRQVLDEIWETDQKYTRSPREVWERREVSRYRVLLHKYGYVPGRPTLVGLICCMFLHSGFWHIFGNMLYLWIFGDNIEARLGAIGYIVAYLGTGVLATLSFAVFEPGSMIPLVGASGAISGVLGFYMVWYPRNQVRVLVLFFFIMFVHVRAVWVLGFYLIWSNILFPLMRGGGDGVAYIAHVGGFVAGMIAAYGVNVLRGSPRKPHKRAYERVQRVKWGEGNVRAQLASAVEDPSKTFRESIEAGRMEDAAHAFTRLVQEHAVPPPSELVYDLAEWLYRNEFAADAVAVFRYYLVHYPKGDDLDRAHLGLGILLGRLLEQPAAAREHFLAAIGVTKDESIAARARDELDRLGA